MIASSSRYGPINDIAWYSGNNLIFGTKPVSGKLPNALGLYDMIGNVREWNQDVYGAYSSANVTNPTRLPPNSYCVTRGGS